MGGGRMCGNIRHLWMLSMDDNYTSLNLEYVDRKSLPKHVGSASEAVFIGTSLRRWRERGRERERDGPLDRTH